MTRLLKLILGSRNLGASGLARSLRGLRSGDQQQLYLGLALATLAYLEKTRPRKRLLYRRTLSPGSALVIHNRRSGDPKIQVVK